MHITTSLLQAPGCQSSQFPCRDTCKVLTRLVKAFSIALAENVSKNACADSGGPVFLGYPIHVTCLSFRPSNFCAAFVLSSSVCFVAKWVKKVVLVLVNKVLLYTPNIGTHEGLYGSLDAVEPATQCSFLVSAVDEVCDFF